MAQPITVPRLGWTMDEGTFAGWLKADGDHVQVGEALFALESDKATENVEALDAGILRIPADGPQVGDKVKVGQVLAHLVADGESLPVGGGTRPAVAALALPTPAPVNHGPQSREAQARPASSPRARRVARELGVDWTILPGTGRRGRIRERDVRAAAPSVDGGRVIPHTPVRKAIAARMVAGVTQAAPVTLTTKVDATNLVDLRQQFTTTPRADDVIPGYSDILMKLTALALRQHPLLQAQWREDGLFIPANIHIAFAVDTEAGLLAPVIENADQQSLRQLAGTSRELVTRARAGTLQAAQLRGATFTISNLGALGVDAFTPIITLPQCAVLGVGRIVREPAVIGDRVVPADRLTLSLTFDHRVLDGAPAARFLDTLRQGIENPAPWLIP